MKVLRDKNGDIFYVYYERILGGQSLSPRELEVAVVQYNVKEDRWNWVYLLNPHIGMNNSIITFNSTIFDYTAEEILHIHNEEMLANNQNLHSGYLGDILKIFNIDYYI